MATKHASVYPSSPANDDSENEGQEDSNSQDDNEEDKKPDVSNVADILKRLQSSGALIKKPKQEYRCHTCEEDFHNWEELENHIIQHVSLPSVVLDKLPSDDEAPSGDENWSDEDEDVPPTPVKTPQKIDISHILNKSGITLKKSADSDKNSDAAISKLSGLGFTIKKGNTPVKTEPESNANNVMQKLGQLGGIKLKLKSEGSNTNSFKVVNGLKDFNASDDEDEDGGKQDSNDEQDKSGEQEEGSAPESDAEDGSPKGSKTSESDDSAAGNKSFNIKSLKNLQGMSIQRKEPLKVNPTPGKVIIKEMPQQKPPGRPVFKQTPKRGTNTVPSKQIQNPTSQDKVPTTPERRDSESLSRESRDSGRESHDSTVENVAVKQEVEAVETQSSNVPIFANQIKTERSSPPPSDSFSTPVLARVKTEPEITPQAPVSQPNQSIEPISTPQNTTPLLPVTKTEDTGVTIIEINGDSNDEDDDCCVVSATPAPDVKPIVPKVESVPSYPTSAYPSSQPSYGSSSMLSSRLTAPSTEKQHSFNWNAPDSKPAIDILEKSADEIFESLLSNSTKKESHSLSDASEYISLDTLGPQHSCDVCNTRFTSISLLEDHIRMTGHAKAIDTLTPSSSSLMPYHPNPASNLLSSLLPVKQLADQVGKLSTVSQSMGGSGPGFTHQQNVMINIQAYPGSGGMMMPPQNYNAYQPGQTDFAQTANNINSMYGGQTMPGQYPGQTFGQGYGQFQQPMPKPGYQSHMPGQYPQTPYSATSALQGMQQAVYGQAPTGGMSSQMGPQMGQMGPGQQMGQMGPSQQMGQTQQMAPPSGPYVPSSSPGGAMKAPGSGIKIQNVQTFTPGQMLPPGQTDMGGQGAAPGQVIGGQMPPPNQIRMAPGAITGNITRPRMANPRGPRPSIRPGVQVHSQVRGQKPMRMPLKRPGGNVAGPGMKRRPDMLLPGKHDNEDCHVMSMQKQRDGLPMIQSVQGAKDKLNLGSQISVTKKTVNKEANAMANVLASRGISVKQKQKSRSPTPERPIPHIPNLGAGVSIKHTSRSSNFSIPEAKVGGGMLSCKICNKMFMNHNSLAVHMSNAHPQSKVPMFKCDECPASYAKMLQLQHHRKVFHNVAGPNRELGLPVVDLSQEDNLRRLSNLGIYSFIPLANREQASGCFGIPVISVHNMQNGVTNSLQALGADGLLSLGPLKPLPNT